MTSPVANPAAQRRRPSARSVRPARRRYRDHDWRDGRRHPTDRPRTQREQRREPGREIKGEARRPHFWTGTTCRHLPTPEDPEYGCGSVGADRSGIKGLTGLAAVAGIPTTIRAPSGTSR